MRYRIVCPDCGESYVYSHSQPRICPECGRNLSEVTSAHGSGTRGTAESRMAKMEELFPRLAKAYQEYESLRKEWVKHLACVASYHARGIVSDEEYNRYLGRPYEKRSSL